MQNKLLRTNTTGWPHSISTTRCKVIFTKYGTSRWKYE